MCLAGIVVAQSGGAAGGDLPLLLFFTALMLWLGGEAFLVWYRYGRLPIDERYKYENKFKSDIFVRVPGLCLVLLGIVGTCLIAAWTISLLS